jgi:hypothetical protein
MQRFNRRSESTTIVELLGETAEDTYNYFEPRRERNEATTAPLLIPDHQRFYVWSESRKAPLIDSIMENCPLPLMVFTQEIYGGKSIRFVQDGQQRLMTIQKFMLGEFKWNDKLYSELTPQEHIRFLSYKLNCDIIINPTPEQVADMFERLNCGKPLTDNDKFFNRRDSPVISFILNELIKHPNLSQRFKKYTGLNVSSKTRVQLSDIVGAVVAILTNSVHCIRTSFDRIGQELYQEMTDDKKAYVIEVFGLYFNTVKQALEDAHINKPKKQYLKLSNMLGIWLYWRIHEDYYSKEISDMDTINQSCRKWIWFAQQIQSADKKKNIFSDLSAGHQRNIDVDALSARTKYLMELEIVNAEPINADETINAYETINADEPINADETINADEESFSDSDSDDSS